MPAKRKAQAKKPSGPTQAESERKNPQMLLRLSPLVQRIIRERAKAKGVDMSVYVATLVMADVARLGGIELPR